MSFYDADGDGELRLEDLRTVEEKCREDYASAIRELADNISEAIKNSFNATP